MRKRYISLLLCFVLCFGLFAMPAAADETSLITVTGATYDSGSGCYVCAPGAAVSFTAPAKPSIGEEKYRWHQVVDGARMEIFEAYDAVTYQPDTSAEGTYTYVFEAVGVASAYEETITLKVEAQTTEPTALPAFPSAIGVEVYEGLTYVASIDRGDDTHFAAIAHHRYYAQVTIPDGTLESGHVIRYRVMNGETPIIDQKENPSDNGWKVLQASDSYQVRYVAARLPAGSYSLYFVVSTQNADGSYTDVSQVSDAYTITLSKADAYDPSMTKKPTPIELTYNGEKQTLVTRGSIEPTHAPDADHEFIHYLVINQETYDQYESNEAILEKIDALGSTGLDTTNKWESGGYAYAPNEPKGENAGIYYVYYRVGKEDGTSCAKAFPSPVVVTIAKATPTVVDQTITYGKTLGELDKARGVKGEALDGTFVWTTADGAAVTDDTILDAGTHVLGWTFTPTGDSAVNYEAVTNGTATITVEKADITPTLAIDGWTYGETVSTPTLTGNLGNGNVTYYYNTKGTTDLGDGIDEEVAATLDAGNYFLFADVDATANYNAGTTNVVPFTIAKASVALEVSIEGWMYKESANAPSVTGNTGNGAVTYYYKAKDADDSTYTTDVPTAVGEYIVKAVAAETKNYQSGEGQTDFAIKGLEIKLGKFEIGKLTYTGAAQTPTVTIKADTADGSEYTIAYSADGVTYSETVPTYTEAGTHRLYVKLSAENHEDLEFYEEFEIKGAKKDNAKPAQAPRTGDSATPILWIVILVVAIAAVVVLLVAKKKKRK